MEFKDKVDPRHTALLIVDMQNDYCHPRGALAQNGADLSTVTSMTTRLLELVAAARHAGVRIIFIRTTHDEWTDSPVRRALPRFQDMYVCRTDSWGAEFFTLSPEPGDRIVTKHRYSAFINTPLERILRAVDAKSVIVTGVATHVCVDCTARDAFQRDFFVIIPADCTATYSAQLHEAALANLQRHYGDIVTAEEIVASWAETQIGRGGEE